ncbi:MAG TPA: chaperonin family protein RbcX [Candidatus Obscuribacterales bacterium]
MDLKRIAKDTVKVLVSYLTYQAVRVVVSQLGETNPPLSLWLNNFSTTGKIQDGEVYLSDLMRANQDLAFRVMTVRAHLAEEVADYLPEMVRTGIQQANMEHRRQYLERMTQLSAAAVPELEATPDVMEEGDRSSD